MSKDKEILKALHEGSESAFEYIYKEMHTSIFLVARKHINSEDDAKDVRANCFMKLWDRRDKLVFNSMSELYTWLKVTATNNCIDQKRKTTYQESKKQDIINNNLQDQDNYVFEVEDKEAAILNRLMARIENLPPKFKTVFKMRWLDDLLFREIASKLGEDVSTVKKRYARAIKLIKTYSGFLISIL